MKGRNSWMSLWLVMQSGFLIAMLKHKKKTHGVEAQWFAKTKEIQKNSSWQKANGYCFFGQKICFAGGFHESKSNSYIISVMWDVKTIKEGHLEQMAWPTDFGCYVAWQHMTPHCCVHSPAAQAIQVRISWPSTVQSGPDPYQLSLVPLTQNFLSTA